MNKLKKCHSKTSLKLKRVKIEHQVPVDVLGVGAGAEPKLLKQTMLEELEELEVVISRMLKTEMMIMNTKMLKKIRVMLKVTIIKEVQIAEVIIIEVLKVVEAIIKLIIEAEEEMIIKKIIITREKIISIIQIKKSEI